MISGDNEEDSEPSSTGFEEFQQDLKKRQRNQMIRGMFLLLGMFLPFTLVILNVSDFVLRAASLVVGIGISFIGVLLIGMSFHMDSPVFRIRLLYKINPNVFISDKFAVTKYNEVIIFVLLSGNNNIYLASLDLLNAVRADKIKIPTNVSPRYGSMYAGFQIVKRNGLFAIPTPEGVIVAGECRLIIVPVMANIRHLNLQSFSRMHFLELADLTEADDQ